MKVKISTNAVRKANLNLSRLKNVIKDSFDPSEDKINAQFMGKYYSIKFSEHEINKAFAESLKVNSLAL